MKIEKNLDYSRIAFFSLPFLTLLLLLGTGQVFSLPTQQEETVPQIRIDDVNFRVREIESTPSPLKLLEIQVGVFNQSQRATAPPNSIKLAVVAKKVTFLGPSPKDGSGLHSEITTLDFPLPPRKGRIFIIAFSLPEEGLESMTFEIQINPPEGEKKTVPWRGN
jgi:hypothetical protein